MRVMDAIHAFPALVLALAITAALGTGIVNIMIAIGIVYMPSYARLVRGQVLSVRRARLRHRRSVARGQHLRLMFLHIWPNVTAPIIVQGSLNVSTAILTEASLSFLGLGVRPPTPSWGSSLQGGYQYLSTAPWLSILPGLAIFIAVLGVQPVRRRPATASRPTAPVSRRSLTTVSFSSGERVGVGPESVGVREPRLRERSATLPVDDPTH